MSLMESYGVPSRSSSGDTQIASPPSESIVFRDIITEKEDDDSYEAEILLSYRAHEVLYNDVSSEPRVLKNEIATTILRKLDEMGDTVEERFNIEIERFKYTNDLEVDSFSSKIKDGGKIKLEFTLDELVGGASLYLFWNNKSYKRVNFKDRVEKILSDILSEYEEVETTSPRRLDFGEETVDNKPRLQNKDDEALTFYRNLRPALFLLDIDAEPQPINNTVFDLEMNQDVMLSDFMLPGGKLVFLYNGKQIGIRHMPLIRKVIEGDGIFYECSRVFPYNPQGSQLGTFEFEDIYAQPYIELALTSRFYIPLEEFEMLLYLPAHPYWELKDTGQTLQATASRSSVIAGGPVQSQLHCQDGSDLKVYRIEPYMPTQETEEEAAVEIPKIVTFQRGEERTPMDISQNARVGDVKQVYGEKKGLTLSTLKLIFMGKLLKDEDMLTPGTVVQVMGGTGGRRRTYRRRKHGKKTRTNK